MKHIFVLFFLLISRHFVDGAIDLKIPEGEFLTADIEARVAKIAKQLKLPGKPSLNSTQRLQKFQPVDENLTPQQRFYIV